MNYKFKKYFTIDNVAKKTISTSRTLRRLFCHRLDLTYYNKNIFTKKEVRKKPGFLSRKFERNLGFFLYIRANSSIIIIIPFIGNITKFIKPIIKSEILAPRLTALLKIPIIFIKFFVIVKKIFPIFT